MISFLNGTLAAKTTTCAYIDVSGVGFEVNMPHTSISQLPDTGSKVMVHTYLHVSDSGFALYGFLLPAEERLFKNLISVSGIGPKIALAALSTFDVTDLALAIAAQDVSAVSKIPGVGKKSAQRIILELKDKVAQDAGTVSSADAPEVASDVVSLVRAALLSMGFTDSECTAALKGANGDFDESGLLQYALRKLGD